MSDLTLDTFVSETVGLIGGLNDKLPEMLELRGSRKKFALTWARHPSLAVPEDRISTLEGLDDQTQKSPAYYSDALEFYGLMCQTVSLTGARSHPVLEYGWSAVAIAHTEDWDQRSFQQLVHWLRYLERRTWSQYQDTRDDPPTTRKPFFDDTPLQPHEIKRVNQRTVSEKASHLLTRLPHFEKQKYEPFVSLAIPNFARICPDDDLRTWGCFVPNCSRHGVTKEEAIIPPPLLLIHCEPDALLQFLNKKREGSGSWCVYEHEEGFTRAKYQERVTVELEGGRVKLLQQNFLHARPTATQVGQLVFPPDVLTVEACQMKVARNSDGIWIRESGDDWKEIKVWTKDAYGKRYSFAIH